MTAESEYMNELLTRVGSEVRVFPGSRIGPSFYTLFKNILDRLDALEQLNELGRHQL